MIKINLAKLGTGVLTLLKDNSDAIVGSLTMVGLALLCKKVEIPYQVLGEPYRFNRDYSADHSPRFFLMPNNAVEAAIGAIYDGLSENDWDSTRETAAKEIYSILVANRDNLQESTKTYAINALRRIADSCRWSSTKEVINKIIAKIGKGDI